jgi:hypothetical protein
MLCKLLACSVLGAAMHRRVYRHRTNTMIRGPEAADAKFSHLRYSKPNRRYLWLPRSDMATDGVIETTEQRRIYRHPLHPDKMPLGPPSSLLSVSESLFFGAKVLLKKRLSVLAKSDPDPPLTNGSGSRGPKNIWLRIRITDEMLA